MICFDTRGEKFSERCVLSVIGAMCLRGRLTVRRICADTGLSKVTVGRVIRYLQREAYVRKYGYRSIFGRGAKPAEYYLSPKFSCALLDLRPERLALYAYPLSGAKRISVAPKIVVSRPTSDKFDVIREECFSALKKQIPDKYLLSLAVLYDRSGASYPGFAPDYTARSLPENTEPDFRFTPEELWAYYTESKHPGKKALFICVDGTKRVAASLAEGKVLYSEDLPNVCAPSPAEGIVACFADLFRRHGQDVTYIYFPYLSAEDERYVSAGIRSACASPGHETVFCEMPPDTTDIAAKLSMEIATGANIP